MGRMSALGVLYRSKLRGTSSIIRFGKKWKKMFYIRELLIFFVLFKSVFSSYSGPYLFWGIDNLKNVQLPALESVDEKTLTTMYTEAKAVVIFLRNSTSKLDKAHFPKFRELITNSKWSYFPQTNLPAEPVDYNSNVEIISLVGPTSQQDTELSALYRDAVTIYGDGEVLGILANQADEGHFIFKREIEVTSTTSSPNLVEEPMQANCVYLAKQGLMYTSSPPVLTMESGDEKTPFTTDLKEHGLVTDDNRYQTANMYRLIIRFKSIILRFRFPISNDYWSLDMVEVDINNMKVHLTPEEDPPNAPIGFSYSCPRSLVFRNGSNTLTFKDIQVQPLMQEGQTRFSDAYDCIGFMTAPIWSGIFVSAIILFGTFVGILALMDIKTPNRFETNRNKQLTFTVQE